MPFRRFLLGLLGGASAWAGAEEPPPKPSLSLLRQIDQGFVEVYLKVAPSVVVIDAVKHQEEGEAEEIESLSPFLEEKGRPTTPHRDEPRAWKLPQQPARSEASGFIFRSDGYILTNLHVISDAEKFTVRLKEGRALPGKLIAADELTDIAVIKIEARDLTAVEMGDSDALRVGQLVCAIGTPFSQEYSFTCGWVSGKGRNNLLSSVSGSVVYEDYIQTDAFINPGNSGGPLFDVEGKVVGMNTLINGIGRGLAFAIPSNILAEVAEQLIVSGKVIRPWLGIRIESLGQNAELRERVLGLEEGVVIDTIEANAPAYRSELRPADIVTEIDGFKVTSAHELQKEVLKKRVGQVLRLTVWRNGQTLTIPVETGELPSEAPKAAPALKKEEERSGGEAR